MEPQIIIPRGEPDKPSLDTTEPGQKTSVETTNPTETTTPNVETTPTDIPTEEYTQIEINDAVYDLDASGNAIDKDGTVFKTAAEIKALEEAQPEESSLSTLTDVQQRVNIIPKDNTGKPIVYSDDAEGLARYTSDVLKLREQELRDTVKKDFFTENPDLVAAYNYKLQTGSLDGFTPSASWKDFDTTIASADDLTKVIVAYRKSLGDDDTSINLLLDSIKESKKIVDYAENAKKQLVKREEDNIASAIRAEEETKAQQQKEVDDYWNNVNRVITSGKIVLGDETVIIPEVMRRNENGVIKTYGKNDFYKYVNEVKPFTVGNESRMLTQYQYEQLMKMNARNYNDEIVEALQMFVKNDTSQIIKRTLKEERVNNIKRLNNKVGDSSSSVTTGTGKIIIKRK